MQTENDFLDWFAGLVDGEGCFSLFRPKDRRFANPRFSLGLRFDDEPILQLIQLKLGFGRIHNKNAKAIISPRTGVAYIAKPMRYWEVTNVPHCYELVQIFDEHPLRTRKRVDYEVWREVVLDKFGHIQEVDHDGQKAFAQSGQNKELHEDAFQRLKLLHGYQRRTA